MILAHSVYKMAAPSGKGKGKHRPKNRKTKTFLEFDEKLRQEYLRGFQKRKNERRKVAREKHDQRILEERKLLLKQARESKGKSREGIKELPEIDQLVKPEVFDLPDHTVTISNISEVDFVGKTGLRLGQNTGLEEKEEKEDEESEEKNIERPLGKKSLRQQLGQCSNQLSAQKQKVKKLKKKQMLRQKFQSKKKGKKKGKGKKK